MADKNFRGIAPTAFLLGVTKNVKFFDRVAITYTSLNFSWNRTKFDGEIGSLGSTSV